MNWIFTFCLSLLTFLAAIPVQPLHGQNYLLKYADEEDLPQDATFEGTFLDARTWRDKGGDNFFVASEVKHPDQLKNDLYVYHFRVQNGQTSLVWDIKDFATPLCEAVIVPNSLRIIDLDGDGLCESLFMYQFSCDGLDPTVTKLMLHTKGQKLAFRGSIPVAEDLGQVEVTPDPVVSQYPKVFENYMWETWNSFVNGGAIEWYPENHYEMGEFLLLEEEYLFASGGRRYRLLFSDWQPVDLEPQVRELLDIAEDFKYLGDQHALFIASYPKVGVLSLKDLKFTTWVTLFDNTEAISEVAWSPSGKRLAFSAFNPSVYSLETQIFVLDLEGAKMIGKQKFDVSVVHHAASRTVVFPPEFSSEYQLRYPARTGNPDEPDGNWKTLDVQTK